MKTSEEKKRRGRLEREKGGAEDKMRRDEKRKEEGTQAGIDEV